MNYKTELCKNWKENGCCPYNKKCQFAHGKCDLRERERHQKYKSSLCKKFHGRKGTCTYGSRCHFIHNDLSFRWMKCLSFLKKRGIDYLF